MAEATHFSGWDIGGAHLKVSRCDRHGQLINSIELACPLWQGINGLADSLCQALNQLGNQTDRHFITLTGESADCFANRQQGVTEILNAVAEQLPAENCQVFSQSQTWLDLTDAKQHWQQVASMNWLATASWLAKHYSDALLIDIGSTTTDIITITDGQPQLQAFTDQGRLQSGELVYSGVIRTPLMALAQQIPFAGQLQKVANEVFATTADIWRLLNKLPDNVSDRSADGQSWQAANCRQRLARMVGSDAENYPDSDWQQLAQWYGQQQIQQIYASCQQVIKSQISLTTPAPIIGAGVGRFLAAEIAALTARPYLDMANLQVGEPAAIAAPASALALLGWHQFA
ncbi:MAG TPA: hydantoinase/oxoprolinase family protein [Methylophaga sp.]|nr:hydantoinase/oxoprolinase family protein [Methylophaga sp.]